MASNGIGHLLQASDPELALRFDPFNADARINALSAALAGPVQNKQELRRLQADAIAAIRAAPGDARAYSALGALDERNARSDEAFALYTRALALSATELHALIRLFSRAVERGSDARAIRLMDRLLRRYPERFDSIGPMVTRLAGTMQGEAALRRTLARRPPWRASVLRQLAKTTEGASIVERILMAEHAAGVPVPVGDRDALVRAMLRRRSYAGAYAFFLATLESGERGLAGYVFNARFSAPPEGFAFGWRIGSTAGADVAVHDEQGKGDAGLLVNFIGAPTALGNVSQLLNLPPGRYTLAATASASGLIVPRGLFWRISCKTVKLEFASAAIPPGTYTGHTVTTGFTVPPDCPLQKLQLVTGVHISSWRSAYRGRLIVHAVEITRGRE